MFKYTLKRFAINWTVLALAFILIASLVFGYNSLDGSFNLFGGFESLWTLFVEGIATVLLIVAFLIVVAAIVVGLVFLFRVDYKGKPLQLTGAIVLVLVIVILALILYREFGFDWIVWPENGGGSIAAGIGSIVFVTVVTALVTERTK